MTLACLLSMMTLFRDVAVFLLPVSGLGSPKIPGRRFVERMPLAADGRHGREPR